MKRLAALLLAAGLVLGACADDSSGPDPEANPKDALISAFENLSQSEGLSMVMSFDATTESISQLDSMGGGDPMAEEDAQKLLDSRLSVIAKGEGPDAQFEMVVTVAGEDDVTLKVVDKVLYVQVDAEGLAETFGADTGELDKAETEAAAAGMGFVKPLLDGEWVAVTGADELAEQFGAPVQESDEAKASQQQLIEDMTNALRDHATVNSEGTDDAGDRLSVELPLREMYSSFTNALQQNPAAAAFPFGQLPPETEVPNETIAFDVWVEDDTVTQLAFDLAQLAKFEEGAEVGERVAILLELDEFDGNVEVPDDAVEVSAQEIFQAIGGAMMPGMMGGAGAGGETAPGAGFDCSQLQGAPPSVIEQFAEECPELQDQ